MQTPAPAANEEDRIAALHDLHILDTRPEERFDRYTKLIKRLMNVPIALVSLVDTDRQWFKSKQGLETEQTSRDVSFCGHAILGDEIMVVEDASCDERFADNPLVTGYPNIRFYAGCPLKAPDGLNVGTICIIDHEPRALAKEDLELLRDVSRLVARELTSLGVATTDELTGVSNLLGLESLISQALAAKSSHVACIIMIDFDNFNEIKDSFGDEEGDRLLVELTALMLDSFGDLALLARLGGDQFCAFQPDSVIERPGALVARLKNALDERNRTPGQKYAVDFSYAVVKCSAERSLEDLLDEAKRLVAEQKQEKKHADSPESR